MAAACASGKVRFSNSKDVLSSSGVIAKLLSDLNRVGNRETPAVLGLGHIGALAGKPVMEGKAVLFKRFANIDVFDIEVDTTDLDARICHAELHHRHLRDFDRTICFGMVATY